MKRAMIFVCALLFLFASSSAFAAEKAAQAKPSFSPHQQLKRILSKAFDKQTVHKIFSDPRLQLDRSVVAKAPKEPPAPSTLFTPESIERGKAFLKEYEYLLWENEQKGGVERETIAAILRVETNFGQNLGTRSVLNTLYSIYILSPKKRNYALKELVAFIELAGENNWDFFATKGSIAGALGMPQFIPSSYRHYAFDGNRDGVVDLFSHADSIASISYYLKVNGWSKKPSQKRKAVFAYNHDWQYVDDVLDYAAALKEAMPK